MFNSTWQVSAFISLQTSCMGGDAFDCCNSLPCSLYPETFCIACRTLEDVALSVLWLERFVWLWLILIAYFFFADQTLLWSSQQIEWFTATVTPLRRCITGSPCCRNRKANLRWMVRNSLWEVKGNACNYDTWNSSVIWAGGLSVANPSA